MKFIISSFLAVAVGAMSVPAENAQVLRRVEEKSDHHEHQHHHPESSSESESEDDHHHYEPPEDYYDDELCVYKFGRYPGYEGPIHVSGKVDIKETDNCQVGYCDRKYKWYLHGADPACANGANASAPNSCGVHVHGNANNPSKRTTCEEVTDVDGHYYARYKYFEIKSDCENCHDPWTNVSYTSDTKGNAEGSHYVDTRLPNIHGRVFIVHDFSGLRVGCGYITRCNKDGHNSGDSSGSFASSFTTGVGR